MAFCLSSMPNLERAVYYALKGSSRLSLFKEEKLILLHRSACQINHYKSNYPFTNSPIISRYFSIKTSFLHSTNQQTNVQNQDFEVDDLVAEFEKIKEKIIFNTILQRNMPSFFKKQILNKNKRLEKLKKINTRDDFTNIPVSLKYLHSMSEVELNSKEGNGVGDVIESKSVQMPYSIETDLNISNYKEYNMNNKSKINITEEMENERRNCNFDYSDIRGKFKSTPMWLSDYECYDENEDDIDVNSNSWQLNYGTPNSSIPVSNVPCGGCGALLHCQDSAIPGYLPSELFIDQDDEMLRSLVCQRCHFMKHYNTALNVIVSPDDYPKLLSHLKNQKALIILMVDLLDFPCSLWPGIMDIIDKRQPIFVVGNKIDILPADSRGYVNRIKECLRKNLQLSGIPPQNIKHISLISAITGYGVEELITKLHNLWEYKGDVYILGCTNVGKSTLFNTLLQSDYCKVKAVDLIQRATTSPWPGTTINLLKFPIYRPSGWRLYVRTKRIMSERQQIQAEQKLYYDQLKKKKNKILPTLIGHIGMTFSSKTPVMSEDPFSMQRNIKDSEPKPLSGLDPTDETNITSKWCYDSPGVVHHDQVIHLLTTEELMLTLPKKLILPRTFRITSNMSLFIGGLGRLDYIKGDGPIRMTVFASEDLPITVCQINDADTLYDALLGSKLLAVPCGGSDRLAHWPSLKAHSTIFKLDGCGWGKSCGDILLSSAGWIAITIAEKEKCEFQAWTPEGRGMYLRQPALLPFSVNLRGPKIRGSPAYFKGRAIFM